MTTISRLLPLLIILFAGCRANPAGPDHHRMPHDLGTIVLDAVLTIPDFAILGAVAVILLIVMVWSITRGPPVPPGPPPP